MTPDVIRFAVLSVVVVIALGGVALALVAVWQTFGDLLWVIREKRRPNEHLYVWTMLVSQSLIAVVHMCMATIITSGLRAPRQPDATPDSVMRAWLFIVVEIALVGSSAILLWAWNKIRPQESQPHTFWDQRP